MSWHSTPTIFKANNDSKKNVIPIIDLFAGPGGLGEGFSALGEREGMSFFKVLLAIEKEKAAHGTLRLRRFFRQFPLGEVQEEYYDFLRGILLELIDESSLLFSNY